MCVLQVPWPPRSTAESWKRRPRWEKWSSKTLRGAVRATDQPAGRGDAHGHVFPTRDPCRSRARWVYSSQGWRDARKVLFGEACHQTCDKTASKSGFSWKKYVPVFAASDQLSVKSELLVSPENTSKSTSRYIKSYLLTSEEFHRGISKKNMMLSPEILCWQNGCFWWRMGNSNSRWNTGNTAARLQHEDVIVGTENKCMS